MLEPTLCMYAEMASIRSHSFETDEQLIRITHEHDSKPQSSHFLYFLFHSVPFIMPEKTALFPDNGLQHSFSVGFSPSPSHCSPLSAPLCHGKRRNRAKKSSSRQLSTNICYSHIHSYLCWFIFFCKCLFSSALFLSAIIYIPWQTVNADNNEFVNAPRFRNNLYRFEPFASDWRSCSHAMRMHPNCQKSMSRFRILCFWIATLVAWTRTKVRPLNGESRAF